MSFVRLDKNLEFSIYQITNIFVSQSVILSFLLCSSLSRCLFVLWLFISIFSSLVHTFYQFLYWTEEKRIFLPNSSQTMCKFLSTPIESCTDALRVECFQFFFRTLLFSLLSALFSRLGGIMAKSVNNARSSVEVSLNQISIGYSTFVLVLASWSRFLAEGLLSITPPSDRLCRLFLRLNLECHIFSDPNPLLIHIPCVLDEQRRRYILIVIR